MSVFIVRVNTNLRMPYIQ